MKFLKENNLFSFKYGGVSAFSLEYTKECVESDDALTSVYTFSSGLKVTNIAKKHKDHGVYEWVNYFENTSSLDTEIISELYDADVALQYEHEDRRERTPWQAKIENHMSIYSIHGSQSSDIDFSTSRSFIFPGESKRYKSFGGRSSDGTAPYFNINKGNIGVIAAIGWTGQWNFCIEREEDALRLKSKIEDTEFYLKPGEKIRTSSFVLMQYSAPLEESYNLWRKFMKDKCSDTITRVGYLPVCANIWGGTVSGEAINRIKKFHDFEIPYSHIWMDAGWSGKETEPTYDEFTGDWYSRVGDWTVSPKIHKNGLKDVVNFSHECGYKYILWFEPERARNNTDVVREHPEYFLSSSGENKLLNLGNPEAYEYIKDRVFGIIDKLSIDCYRQDFNFCPLEFWRSNDEENRRGITEIKHIMALYRFFDEMLEKFPGLIIDNCASGGRRLDIEMMKRSFPLWRSDAQCPADPTPEITQIHNVNYSMYLPYTGTGCGRIYDTYTMRSSYSPGLGSNFAFSMSDVFGDDIDKAMWLKHRIEEFISIRHYFKGDIYKLTEPTVDNSTCLAVQWNIPEKNEGMIQIFKREACPYTDAAFNLRAIDKNKSYLFKDIDGGECEISGEDLIKSGFKVHIEEKRVAKIYTYKAI